MKEDSAKLETKRYKISGAHPSSSLDARARGYGIGGAYERPYRKPEPSSLLGESYGPNPHSGYYGAGVGTARFKPGSAGFESELSWFRKQYGEETAGQDQEPEHT